MERGPDSENRVIKTGRFPWRTTKKLGSSKEVDGNSKKSREETVWQEKTKFIGTETRRQYMAGG